MPGIAQRQIFWRGPKNRCTEASVGKQALQAVLSEIKQVLGLVVQPVPAENPMRQGADIGYSGPQNLDSMISYTWRLKTGGPSGKNEKELSAII